MKKNLGFGKSDVWNITDCLFKLLIGDVNSQRWKILSLMKFDNLSDVHVWNIFTLIKYDIVSDHAAKENKRGNINIDK